MEKYIVYKTTTDFDDTYYIGIHKTSTLKDDGYRGSGYLLRKKINKYGIEHFFRETLFSYDTLYEAAAKEKELVNDTLLNDPLCMNLTYGGGNGWTLINNERKLGLREHPIKDKHHSAKTKQKIKDHHQPCNGKNNGNYRSSENWVTYTDGLTNIKIGNGLYSFYIPNNFKEGCTVNKKGHQIKILIIPDIHSKREILDKFIKIIFTKNRFYYDKVIFLGDYIDGFIETNEDMIYCLTKVIELKKQYKDKVILLLANHEMSYLGQICSGHRYDIENIITNLLLTNKQLFQFCYAINDTIFSHAGLTKGWLKEFGDIDLGNFSGHCWDKNCEIQRIVNCINSSLFDVSIPGYFRSGGYYMGSGSCIWADKRELLADYINGCNQVVGHTPVSTIEIYNKSINNKKTSYITKLVFTDTFSTYKDGTIYGDTSYIEYYPKCQNKDKQFNIKYLL